MRPDLCRCPQLPDLQRQCRSSGRLPRRRRRRQRNPCLEPIPSAFKRPDHPEYRYRRFRTHERNTVTERPNQTWAWNLLVRFLSHHGTRALLSIRQARFRNHERIRGPGDQSGRGLWLRHLVDIGAVPQPVGTERAGHGLPFGRLHGIRQHLDRALPSPVGPINRPGSYG